MADLSHIQEAIAVIDADAEKLLGAVAAQDVETILKLFHLRQPRCQLCLQSSEVFVHPYQVGAHQAVKQFGVAQKDLREIGARPEQVDEGAQGRGIFAEQGEEARARANGSDETGHGSQGVIWIGSAGDLAKE